MKLAKEFHFDAAHYLPDYQGKCANLHGHTYEGVLWVEGPVDPGSGMVMDFVVLKACLAVVVDRFDHCTILMDEDRLSECLRELGMKVTILGAPPTVENLAKEILFMLNEEVLPSRIDHIIVKLREGIGGWAVAELGVDA